MKKEIKTPAPMQDSNKENQSLFNSMVDAENIRELDNRCQKYGSRVSLLLKVCYGRQLTRIADDFINQLTELCKTTANTIDNELRSSQKD